MRIVPGLLVSVFFALRIYGKEIPDDDFLESINNKPENPLEYLFPDPVKIKIGPVDDVVRSILSLSPELDKEKMSKIESTEYETSEDNLEKDSISNTENSEMSQSILNKSYVNEKVIENLKTLGDDAYGSNLLEDEEYHNGYKNMFDDNVDEKDNDSDHHYEVMNAEKNKKENLEKLHEAKLTTVKDIDSLPPQNVMAAPKHQYKEPDFNFMISTLFHPFFNIKFGLTSKNVQPTAIKENEEVKDDKQLKMSVRSKRSMQPLFSRHQHYWTWHNPYQTFEAYPKIFDSIASGIIGKRSQIDYPREDIRPLVMN